MIRRNFLKTLAATIGGLIVPRKAEASSLPFLPTLEWLREHNPDLMAISFTYSDAGFKTKDDCSAELSPSVGRRWHGHACRKMSSPHNFGDVFVRVFFDGSGWIAVDHLTTDTRGVYSYYKEIEWPHWLRKF